MYEGLLPVLLTVVQLVFRPVDGKVKGEYFETVRAANGAVLCLEDQPDHAVIARSLAQCSGECAAMESGCTNFNWRSSGRCELFNRPTVNFGTCDGCRLFQVTCHFCLMALVASW